MSCQRSNRGQGGAALVIALLVFALAAALMVGVQRDFNLQLQRSTNTFFAEQGWSFLLGAETLAALALRFDSDQDAKSDTPVDSLQEIWAQPQAPYPLDGIGFLSGNIYDLQGRFNLNGLVEQNGNSDRDPNTPERGGAAPLDTADATKRLNTSQRILLRLLLSIDEAELSQTEAIQLVERITDYIDSDRTPRLDGAEDERYLSSAFPYRAANRAIASVSELRAVDGITPELYKRIAPFLSVWPDDGSKINILTAPAEVLAALNEDDSLEPLSQQQVAQIIELRTNGMLVDVDSFLESPLFSEDSTADLRAMVDVKSSWFLLDSRVDIADRERRLYSVLHRQGRAISIVHRTEGEL